MEGRLLPGVPRPIRPTFASKGHEHSVTSLGALGTADQQTYAATPVRARRANMSMTLDTPQDSEALAVGFEAVRTSSQFGRDLATVWVAAAQQMVLLSVETNEAAIEAFRSRFWRPTTPTAADLWNWWASAAAGLLGAYE